MNIPDKAVEAAARVFYASQTGGDNLDTSYNRQAWLNVAKRALADAAPFIAAQVLRDFDEFARNEHDRTGRSSTVFNGGFGYALRLAGEHADDLDPQ